MTNRVNKIRIWYKQYGEFGIFRKCAVSTFVTPEAAGGFIRTQLSRPSKIPRTEHGSVFGRLEVGNDRGWAKYDITIGPLPVTEDSIRHAMDMHLSFYDDGESAKEYAS